MRFCAVSCTILLASSLELYTYSQRERVTSKCDIFLKYIKLFYSPGTTQLKEIASARCLHVKCRFSRVGHKNPSLTGEIKQKIK